MQNDYHTPSAAMLLRPEVLVTNRSEQGRKPSYYPFSLIIITTWAICVAGLVLLLEVAAADARRTLKRPWYYDPLPSILLTIFAQGHSAVTVMYFSRLATSALHLPGRGPASWQELFWQADGAWSGPVSFVNVVYASLRRHVALSWTFFLFTGTCAIALVTPVTLTRAYPVKSIIVPSNESVRLNVFSPPSIQNIEGYAQLATGGGAWSTGESALSVYNSSIFLPVGTPQTASQVDDVFFVGETGRSNLQLPGIRTQGGCQVISNGPVDPNVFNNQICTQLPEVQGKGVLNVKNWNANVSMSWCCTDQAFNVFLHKPASSTASAYIYINSTNTNVTVTGVAMCNVTIFTGLAQLSGQDGTFTDFREAVIYNAITAQGGEPLIHPLSAALIALNPAGTTKFSPPAILNMLGFVPSGQGAQVVFNQPSLEDMVQRIWQGAVHMGSAVGLLGQRQNTYHAIFLKPTTGRVVDRLLSKVAWGMLGLWLLLSFFGTLLLFRPTTMGKNLSAFVASRIVWDRFESNGPWLNGLDNDAFLRSRFDGTRYSKHG